MDNKILKKFLNWEHVSRDTIDVKRIYIDIAEDLVSGIMFSQILYWFLPNKHGENKTRVVKDGEDWIAKTYNDWFQECRITRKQAINSVENLEKLGLIITGMYHFGGRRMTHIRVNWDVFISKFSSLVDNVGDAEFLKDYWDAIKEGDNRTIVSKDKDINVCDQKGNIPKRSHTSGVSDQKGHLGVTKKVTCYTKTTAENTITKNTLTIQELSLEPEISSNTDVVINNKGDVTRFILELRERALKADEYTHEPIFKKDGQIRKDSIEDPEWTFREGKIYNVIKDAIHIISSGQVNWSREGKYLRQLVLMYTRESKFDLMDILECLAWGYHTEQFDYYTMSSLSVPKLMPRFLDLKRTGRLKDSLLMKPKFENSVQRTERIYAERDNEQITRDAKRLYEESAAKHGYKYKPIL